MAELTIRERSRLGKLEAVIERGERTFVEVGRALAEIRDKRLYRQTHDTFEAYLGERWQMSRDWAYKQIAAANVVAVLDVDHGLQPNERQARELVPLLDKPEQLQKAWEKSGNGSQRTAPRVREVVAEMQAPLTSQEDRDAVTVPCYFCGRKVATGSTGSARRIKDGWAVQRANGGANQIKWGTLTDEWACSVCLTEPRAPVREEDLHRSGGTILDLRKNGVLTSIHQAEEAVRGIVMVRRNGLDESHQAEAMTILRWIADEAMKTIEALTGRERRK